MDPRFQILDGHSSDVNWVDFNGRRKLASCSNDSTVCLWEADETGEEIKFRPCSLSPLRGHAYGVNCVRYSPFGTIIASASTDGNIILWNSQVTFIDDDNVQTLIRNFSQKTGEQVVKLQHESNGGIRVCCFSPSSAMLTSGSDDETLVVWDISTRKQIKTLTKHEAKITGCSFTPDSAYLVSCSTAGDLKVWETKYGSVNYVLTHEVAHDLGVLGCDFSSQYEVNGRRDCLVISSKLIPTHTHTQCPMVHCKVSICSLLVATMIWSSCGTSEPDSIAPSHCRIHCWDTVATSTIANSHRMEHCWRRRKDTTRNTLTQTLTKLLCLQRWRQAGDRMESTQW